MRIPERCRNLIVASALPTTLIWSTTGFGGSYFSHDIDYWNRGQERLPQAQPNTEEQKDNTPAEFSGSTLIRAGDSKPFSWKDVLDPQSPAFWDDGGTHIPPRPFREVMVDPSPENIRLYQQWIEKKAALLARFEEALETDRLQEAARGLDLSSVEAFYVFSDSCPACQRDAPHLAVLSRAGLRVRPIHLDGTPSALHPGSDDIRSLPRSAPRPAVTPTWILQTPAGIRVLEGARSPLSVISSLVPPLSAKEH